MPEPKPRLDEDLNIVTALQPKPRLLSSGRARKPSTEKRRGTNGEEREGELSGIVHRIEKEMDNNSSKKFRFRDTF
jgi:hypothetical protein